MFPFSRSADRERATALLAAIDRSQAVIEFDLDGTIQTANANFLNLLGYTLEDIKGRHHRLFVDPAEHDGPEYREFWAGLRSGAYHSGEFLRIGKNGREVWIQATYNPILDRNGKPTGVVKFAADITAAKTHSLEDAGKMAAIGRVQAVIEFALDGTILAANDKFLAALDYSLDEIVGRHHSMFVAPAERDSDAYRDFWRRLNGGEAFTGSFKRFGKGGREVWIMASYNPILDHKGRPFKVVKFANDVTVQKLAAADSAGQIAAIRKSQAVIEFKTDGTILDANDNFLKTTGYSLAEIKGRHHSIFMEPADRNTAAYREFWERLARGEYQAGEFRRVAKDGREVWIQASYNPILDLDGKPYKVVKYASDVTPQVQRRIANEEARGMLMRSAESTEELSSTVQMIAEATNRSRKTTYRAVSEVEVADGQAQRLDEAAKAMSGIAEIIGAITGQINLLALNATIESARAGEAGRGFAVVAQEVKTLAGQARSATDQIVAQIDNLNNIASDVVGALGSIKQAIEAVNEFVASTASTAEEQSAATAEIAASMQRATSLLR
ncbi:PAS domain-containing methyl-accepting chemotaxis protein [Rhodopseudomonas sp. HC1]|uniref:methyl-accepting chemotaxis protein n=1 Tax=Rhodopseudomonas infernalis TaxID=2897386 RepID=UPI001EE7F73A|nr:PAS domain-containing methyl-accepting chemotaxis protein [Rhodopseudomonas infernalis]MCG6207366.1 PAS domain-containing methyl-accepting chemotaxis protein [Rhodopseudomonas infernalis]